MPVTDQDVMCRAELNGLFILAAHSNAFTFTPFDKEF